VEVRRSASPGIRGNPVRRGMRTRELLGLQKALPLVRLEQDGCVLYNAARRVNHARQLYDIIIRRER